MYTRQDNTQRNVRAGSGGVVVVGGRVQDHHELRRPNDLAAVLGIGTSAVWRRTSARLQRPVSAGVGPVIEPYPWRTRRFRLSLTHNGSRTVDAAMSAESESLGHAWSCSLVAGGREFDVLGRAPRSEAVGAGRCRGVGKRAVRPMPLGDLVVRPFVAAQAPDIEPRDTGASV